MYLVRRRGLTILNRIIGFSISIHHSPRLHSIRAHLTASSMLIHKCQPRPQFTMHLAHHHAKRRSHAQLGPTFGMAERAPRSRRITPIWLLDKALVRMRLTKCGLRILAMTVSSGSLSLMGLIHYTILRRSSRARGLASGCRIRCMETCTLYVQGLNLMKSHKTHKVGG